MPVRMLQKLMALALGKRAPTIDGVIELSGTRAPVVLRRDENGIPYVDARNDEDAFFGLGFAQAQDRAFQIELLVRVVRGTLSELVGADGLDVDRLSRRIGFVANAEAQLAASSVATRAQFTSFARGVNAGLAHGSRKKCHELTILGGDHSTFEARDSAAVLGFLAFALSSIFLGVDWLDRHRYDRIVELLSARTDWSIDDVLVMHLDRHSTLTRELAPIFARAATDPVARKWLEPWDGELAPSSVAASIFELTFAELARRIAQRHAPKAWRSALGEGINDVLAHGTNPIRRVGELARLVRALPDSEIGDAVATAVRELRAKFGARDHAWQWGRVRPLRLRHAFAKQAALARIFSVRDIAIGGDISTIPQGSVDFQDPLGDPIGVPNLRAAMDVGAWENSRWSVAGGESGNPCSTHFSDLLEVWDRGEGVAIAWSPDDVKRRARSTLTLGR